MESQPQNPEFRNYLENFHPCDILVPLPMVWHKRCYPMIDLDCYVCLNVPSTAQVLWGSGHFSSLKSHPYCNVQMRSNKPKN